MVDQKSNVARHNSVAKVAAQCNKESGFLDTREARTLPVGVWGCEGAECLLDSFISDPNNINSTAVLDTSKVLSSNNVMHHDPIQGLQLMLPPGGRHSCSLGSPYPIS